MYDPVASLAAIDQHKTGIFICLAITVVMVFFYFARAIQLALRYKLYIVPFIGSAVFFWHDFSFVLLHHDWFVVYNHWWVKMWWFALCGSSALEAYMIWQVIKYGHREFGRNYTFAAYAGLVIAATLGTGAMWFLIKITLNDPLYFVTFAVTAVFSVPLHTGLMFIRGSSRGQCVYMQASTIVMLVCLSAAFAQISNFFVSPVYLLFVAVMVAWACANIVLIRKTPDREPWTLATGRG
jgi:hypothetical protein